MSLLLCTLLILHHPPVHNVLSTLKHDVIPLTCQDWIEACLLHHPNNVTEGDYKNCAGDFGHEPDSYVNNYSLVDHTTHKLGIAYKIGLRSLKSGSSVLQKHEAISV